ncbi:hypothetical protein, partial [Faecalibaculum rodentium]|uniref:hypothetical protein n=1 Tax=Faecalibaculum rodentium TaxID=1702221 RepID=UPI0025B03E3C
MQTLLDSKTFFQSLLENLGEVYAGLHRLVVKPTGNGKRLLSIETRKNTYNFERSTTMTDEKKTTTLEDTVEQAERLEAEALA